MIIFETTDLQVLCYGSVKDVFGGEREADRIEPIAVFLLVMVRFAMVLLDEVATVVFLVGGVLVGHDDDRVAVSGEYKSSTHFGG
ncbi:hypothetical protein JHK86_021281 [Glycine max]|nr:hypothetical protein JHK86_021281 [Glycine max]